MRYLAAQFPRQYAAQYCAKDVDVPFLLATDEKYYTPTTCFLKVCLVRPSLGLLLFVVWYRVPRALCSESDSQPCALCPALRAQGTRQMARSMKRGAPAPMPRVFCPGYRRAQGVSVLAIRRRAGAGTEPKAQRTSQAQVCKGEGAVQTGFKPRGGKAAAVFRAQGRQGRVRAHVAEHMAAKRAPKVPQPCALHSVCVAFAQCTLLFSLEVHVCALDEQWWFPVICWRAPLLPARGMG